MQLIDLDFPGWDSRKKARFINSLAGFKSVNLIGTKSVDDQENLAIVSSVIHLGANPPLIGFISRPNTVERHSLENILSTGFYTINAVSERFYQQAHQTSARYSRSESEFEHVGLTPEYIDGCNAPFVAQSRLKMGMKLIEHHTIAANKTEMVIGQIVMLQIDENALQEDGYLDIEQLDVVTISGLDSYHQTQRLARLSYAKPGQDVKLLDTDGREK